MIGCKIVQGMKEYDLSKIKQLVKRSGRTVKWYSNFVGVTPTHLSGVLSGSRPYSVSVMKLMAMALSVPEKEIFK